MFSNKKKYRKSWRTYRIISSWIDAAIKYLSIKKNKAITYSELEEMCWKRFVLNPKFRQTVLKEVMPWL